MYLFADEAETQIAFEKHFTEELSCYGPVCIINLVEQAGKESVIWEAYTHHVLNYDHPNITYTTFDFHEYWWVSWINFFSCSWKLQKVFATIFSISFTAEECISRTYLCWSRRWKLYYQKWAIAGMIAKVRSANRKVCFGLIVSIAWTWRMLFRRLWVKP